MEVEDIVKNETAIITGVKVNSYESRKMKLELLVSYLIGLTCSRTGILHLELEPDWNLKQTGSLIKPPIRWIHSFEKNASFDFECYVNNDPAMQYMPGRQLQPQYTSDGEPCVFFGHYPENT